MIRVADEEEIQHGQQEHEGWGGKRRRGAAQSSARGERASDTNSDPSGLDAGPKSWKTLQPRNSEPLRGEWLLRKAEIQAFRPVLVGCSS